LVDGFYGSWGVRGILDGCAVFASVTYSTEILDVGARKFLNPY
jgi:hypothetical protein